MYALAAITPFALLFVLMVLWRKPAFISAPITLAVTLIITLTVWQMKPIRAGAALIEGSLVSLEIILIVFGAILLLNVLREADVFKPIEQAMQALTPDKRIQAILIGWFFVSFIEGAAGFGTPAMLAAPLLVMIGFKPLAAVAIALIGDSAAVTFGAVGVPITIGIAEGVSAQQWLLLGQSVSEVAVATALIHLLAGWMVPLFLAVITTYTHDRSIKAGLQVAPLALVSGFCFLIPFYFSAVFLSPEFPSMVGGLVGGTIMIWLIKQGAFMPKQIFDLQTEPIKAERTPPTPTELAQAVLPYLLTVGLLAMTRIPKLGLGEWLQHWRLEFSSILGTEAARSLTPLYSPGFIFALAALIAALCFGLSASQLIKTVSISLQKITIPFIGLLAVLGIVQLLLASGQNQANLTSIPLYLADTLPQTPILGPLFSPLVGVLGSFIAGSSTVSNLLFASFQAGLAESLGLSLVIVLALQAAGSAVGNMIAVHNVLAAQATVGLENREGDIIRLTLAPALIYGLLAGVVGLLLLIF